MTVSPRTNQHERTQLYFHGKNELQHIISDWCYDFAGCKGLRLKVGTVQQPLSESHRKTLKPKKEAIQTHRSQHQPRNFLIPCLFISLHLPLIQLRLLARAASATEKPSSKPMSIWPKLPPRCASHGLSVVLPSSRETEATTPPP